MRAVRTFNVASTLPTVLAPLRALAMNVAWGGDERTTDLFRRIDPDRWDDDGFDLLAFLDGTPQSRLDELAADTAFVQRASDVLATLERVARAPQWFQHSGNRALGLVSYFSPEFGVADALPQYSGGLGVLAGDHLKAANDLGLPLVGVGLFYRQGYFRQALDRGGYQRERFPRLHPHDMALEPVPEVRVTVPLAGVDVHVAVWRAQVGRIPLYLLDTDIDANDGASRSVTDRLYGGDVEQRLRQELVLGVAGVRVLDALGLDPDVFHMNEGHAAFLALERMRKAIVGDGLTLAEAVEATRPAQVFTTHTPVPAGIDRFPRDLVERYFGWWVHECGLALDDLMELGSEPGNEPGAVLNLAALGLRCSGAANGVSALHGDVSRRMFAPLWPAVGHDDVPIGHVTNGVHVRSWASREMIDLFDRQIGSDWADADPQRWRLLDEAPDEELWAIRRVNRERLVAFARRWVRASALARGDDPALLGWVDDLLDPDVLTIGFARRFAPYKRATLLLRDRDRLRALIEDAERPVQFVFAGKAHPADEAGKDLLREIATVTRDRALRTRFVFLEDFGIAVGRMLYRGCDVWLNTPRRPMEACGTSGMKAVLNGGLHCSTLDGWWAECYRPDAGWAIETADWEDDGARDALEADSLYRLLEEEIAPRFYDAERGIPRAWLATVRRSLVEIAPFVTADRMVREYADRYYEDAARRGRAMRADGDSRARALVAWKAHVRDAWPKVVVHDVALDGRTCSPGADLGVRATVDLGDLTPDDVAVHALHGPVDVDDALQDPALAEMSPVGEQRDDGSYVYRVVMRCDGLGPHGLTVRVTPSHPDLVAVADLGCVAWAPADDDSHA